MRNADDPRPDPDSLLQKFNAAGTSRGRLRIYLGAAPGVGKTYAMLNEGRRRKARGADVVVAFAETYNRPLTLEALEGLEVIPRERISYQGVVLEEMDTGAVTSRRPQIALVDELAHTNAPGSRHQKRWEDVEEIRDAGITVITTLNIQHLESLNDVVAGITGVRVRETVPDHVVDSADELEVVDISPEALQARMRHGNVYPPPQAQQALDGFFRKGNLAALRELALKRVAREVEQQLHNYMAEHRLEGWEAGERILVLLDNTPASEAAIRRAWRLAHAFNGELLAAYPAPLLKEQRMTHLLTVALDLNAVTRELPGDNVARELSALVTAEGITHVTLLAHPRRRFRLWTKADLGEQLLAHHPHLEVHTILWRAPEK